MGFKRKLSFIILILVPSAILCGQTVGDTLRIEEVSVYADRPLEEAAINKLKIDSLVMDMARDGSIGELIAAFTPVYVKSAGPGSGAGASVRGTSPTHTIVSWNGLSINSPMRGDVDLSLLPVGFSDRVELLYGAGSLMQSAGGLGGTLSLENRADWNRIAGIYLSADAGSFGTFGNRVEVSGGGKKWWGRIRTGNLRSDNNFTFYNYGVLPNRKDTLEGAAFGSFNAMQEFYLKAGKGILSVLAWEQTARRDLPPLITSMGNDQKEEKQNDQGLYTLSAYRLYRGRHKFEFSAGYHLQGIQYFLSSGSDQITGERYINNNSEGKEQSISIKAAYGYEFSKTFRLNTMAEASRTTVETFDSALTVFTGYTRRRSEYAFLADLHFRPWPQLSGYLLNRSELVDGKLIPLIPAAGVEYRPSDKLPVYLSGSINRNYRFPAMNDLYWIPGGNPALRPERGVGVEGSLKFIQDKKQNQGAGRRGSFDLSLTGFYMLIHDWIEWRPGSRAYYWEPANIGLVCTRGLEFTGNWVKDLGGGQSFRLNGYYAFTRSTNEGEVSPLDVSRGQQLIYIPVHKGGINGEISGEKLRFRFIIPATGRISTSGNLSGDEEGYLPAASSYTMFIRPVVLVNLSAGTRIKAGKGIVDLEVSVRNLLNTPYVAVLNRPAPGRWFTLKLSYELEKRRDD
ncbi:MAG: TonB-dependent receptor [Bacteroidota bacterium]